MLYYGGSFTGQTVCLPLCPISFESWCFMRSSLSPYRYRDGLRDGIPIGLGYFTVAFGFGISAVGQGLRAIEAVLISMTNLTSAGQVAGVAVIAAGGTLLEMILTQLVINMRYALMGISLTQHLDAPARPTWKRMLLCCTLTDEIYATAVTKREPVGSAYLWGLVTLPYIGWASGTLTGALLGSILPERLDAAFGILLYAMFLALLIPPMKRERGIALAVAVAAGLRCVLTYVPLFSGISDGFAVILCAVPAALVVALVCPVPGEEASA